SAEVLPQRTGVTGFQAIVAQMACRCRRLTNPDRADEHRAVRRRARRKTCCPDCREDTLARERVARRPDCVCCWLSARTPQTLSTARWQIPPTTWPLSCRIIPNNEASVGLF